MWSVVSANSGSETRAAYPPAEFDSQAVRQAATEAFRQARPELDALIAAMLRDRTRLLASMAACWLEIRRWSAECRAFELRRRFIVASGPAAGLCELSGPGCGDECPFPSATLRVGRQRHAPGSRQFSEVNES